jgi:hypothetical protein
LGGSRESRAIVAASGLIVIDQEQDANVIRELSEELAGNRNSEA